MNLSFIFNPIRLYRSHKSVSHVVKYYQRKAHHLAIESRYACAERGLRLFKTDREIMQLRGRHLGQRAFIIANGPSLQIADLNRLQREITFASNKIYLAFDRTDWRPCYFTVVDVLIAEQVRDTVAGIKLSKIFPNSVKECFSSATDTLWLRDLRQPNLNNFLFSTNLLRGIYGGWTVVYAQLQLAFWMGIREVFLVGLDFSYSNAQPTSEVCKDGLVVEWKGQANHFDPRYHPPGSKSTVFQPAMQYKAFLSAKNIFNNAGGKIWNASRSTKLDIFPLIDFDQIVQSQPRT